MLNRTAGIILALMVLAQLQASSTPQRRMNHKHPGVQERGTVAPGQVPKTRQSGNFCPDCQDGRGYDLH